MYPYLISAITMLSIFVLTGCKTTPTGKFADTKSINGANPDGNQPGEQALPSAHSMRIPIGTVHMVDEKGKFVLIKSSKATSIDPETRIMAYRPDASVSSNLKVSPARKGAYLTADLVDGMPAVGDMVVMIQTINKNPASPDGNQQGGTADVQVLE